MGQRGFPDGPLAKNLSGADATRFKHLVLDPRTPEEILGYDAGGLWDR